MNPKLGKVAYGFAFCGVLPALLIVWARQLEACVTLPPVHSPVGGALLAGVAMTLMITGIASLWIRGGGAPLNAYPPPRFVSQGIYRLVPQPIYTGFTLTCAGLSVACGSAAGLFVVTPVTALGCAALVWGYERHDLRQRFGVPSPTTLLSLPGDAERPPTPGERASIYVRVFLPWAVAYLLAAQVGLPARAPGGYLPGEAAWPVFEPAEWCYLSAYPVVLLAPLFARTSRDLRRFAVDGLLATAAGVLVFICIPLAVPPKPFVPASLAGRLLEWERGLDPPPGIAFPSFHVIWALIAAQHFGRWSRVAGIAAGVWAVGVAGSCLATGMHAVADLAGGAVVFGLVTKREALVGWAMTGFERLANSWRQWRFGPVRVISHSLLAALAAGSGAWLVGTLGGRTSLPGLVLAAAASLAGGALWAQFIEGSPRLLRPFGYYGGLLGGILGGAASAVFGDAWLLLGALAVAAPMVQAIGRLRCLVQGCCHGRPTGTEFGIRYHNPSSRVCKFTPHTGVPLHPTQVYSIAGNALIAAVLLRLWLSHAPVGLVGGLYLILSSLARFVEEAYRGEPQTRRLARLTEYQWLAIAGVFSGGVVTLLRGGDAPAPAPEVSGAAAWLALVIGLAHGLAMGVDFPNSNRRFARLTG